MTKHFVDTKLAFIYAYLDGVEFFILENLHRTPANTPCCKKTSKIKS